MLAIGRNNRSKQVADTGRSTSAGLLRDRHEFMVTMHVIARGIGDQAVIQAMRDVPREVFVAAELQSQAYEDYPLPIDEGQTISQPYIVAFMVEALELTRFDRVLEIGCGSGYGAAILGAVAAEIHTIERLHGLATSARQRLQQLGYHNITVHEGDGSQGLPEYAPYDAIIVTAGAPRVPLPLIAQLKLGGRLVVPVGASTYHQTLLRIRRTEADAYGTEALCDVRFVPLIGEAAWSSPAPER